MNFKNFNVVQPQEQPKEEVNSAIKMANISIRVDANCFLLCDGEFTEIELQAGKITKVQLPLGQHLLEFIDVENPELKVEKVVEWSDEGKSYLVLVNEFKEVVDALKAKEEAERKAKEERKAEVVYIGEKFIKCKLKDCTYVLDPTQYTAKLTKGTGKNVVVPPIISCLDNDYSVIGIGDNAFDDCFFSLRSIVIPNSVTSIGEYAFAGCDSLIYITIPDSVKSIGDGAFYGCEKLTSITFQGTILQWAEIKLYSEYEYEIIVHCTDGNVEI